jgi:molecular chaperone GrpE
VRRDQEHLRLSAAETVVESLLPVVDNLRRAVEATREHGGEQLAAGVALVYDQLVNTLAGHGLTAVEVEPGVPFDPEVHEAVMTQPSDDHDEGAVLQVMERGYLLHGRLLRPAKVIVAR